MRYLGILFLLIGLGAMYFFLFQFSNAAPVTDGSPTSVNLGLMNDRVCGCIVGAALTIAGAVMGGYQSEAKKTA